MRASALVERLRSAEELLSISMTDLDNDTLCQRITLRAREQRAFRSFAGLGPALLGVLCFSFTVTATRAAVPELGALFVGAGRSLVAGTIALWVLLARAERLPSRSDLRSLALVALGVVFGFPLCSAIALQSVPAVHALVLIGLVPLATALMAVLRNGERPSLSFWIASSCGALAVFAFGLTQSVLQARAADLWLVGSVLFAAFGYGEGARLTPRLGGWRVISWALVLSLPLTIALTAYAAETHPITGAVSFRAWLGFAYVGVVSMYLGFFAWYRGLAQTTIARASQVQLGQPVLGMFWSWLLLGETVTAPMLLTAGFVIVAAVCASRARVRIEPASLPAPHAARS